MKIFVNGRFRAHKITGIQRYAHEVSRRMDFRVLEPDRPLKGWRGHAWEQTSLPWQSRGGVLWSPCGAGPLFFPRHAVTFHDLFSLDSPEWYRPVFARASRILITALSRSAAHVIAVSEFTKRRLTERLKVQADRVTVIHNGVDFGRFYRSEEQANRARAELKLPEGRYLLCVGSVEPRKNLRRLLTAWGEVVSELPSDIRLVVTGSQDNNVFNTAELPAVPERVLFTGYVGDELLNGLYSGALGFVFPSLGEGFGFPPLEAMACGVPVLTSNVTSLPEVCGEAALYADPMKTREIAAGIRELCLDEGLRGRLRERGLTQVAQFTWDRAAAATSKVLLRCAR